jgi:transcription antitermination factor NusG
MNVEPVGPQWYACYTRARHEKRVHAMLEERGIETYLPLVDRVSQWKDRRREVAFPLFPSYVFGRFDALDMHRVLSVPGIATLVRSNGRPAIIPSEELENVRLFVEALKAGDLKPERKPFFAKGQWVEVLDGPLRGVRGIVIESRGRRRVLVGLSAIGQGLEVDITTSLLQPVAGP